VGGGDERRVRCGGCGVDAGVLAWCPSRRH
jgi:hypothetical protein